MSNLIQWPRAKYWNKAWNPVIGCKPCSPACENCYAAAWDKLFGQSIEPRKTSQKPPRHGIVFCGNMTDLFGKWVDRLCPPEYYISQTLQRKNETVYLWLTKRVPRMISAVNGGFERDRVGMSNHYFGFTAESQEWYLARLESYVSGFPERAKSWLSCEPLLGPIDFRFHTYRNLPKWVVVGCESGPNRRPCKIEWVESIVEQCMSVHIPVFVKQLDIGGKCITDINKFPTHLQIRQVPWATKGEPE